MPMFPQLRKHDPKQLRSFFMERGEPRVPEVEQENWLQAVAIRIARTGATGVDFLLSCVAKADELRLRAILLAMSLVAKRLSARKRAIICDLARTLIDDPRPLVVAEAVDTLSSCACQVQTALVYRLLKHPSPYVIGSALRFFARHYPDKAVPLLKKALHSKEPIVRQNAVDELDNMNYTPALPSIERLRRRRAASGLHRRGKSREWNFST